VPTRPSPTVRRRRLGIDLRHLREAVGLSIERVAEALECSESKISRIETGQVGVRPRDLRDILALYGVRDDEREALLRLAREAREKGWWHAYSDLANVRTLIDFEVAATSIRSFSGLVLNGLLQTDGYARAMISAVRPQMRPDELHRWLDLRLSRQALLTDEDPPSYWAILDEAALRRHVGERDVMRKQLKHLTDIAVLPNVTLQVLPFSIGAHAGMSGDFTIFSFPEPNNQDVVYLEHNAGDLYLEGAEEVGRHAEGFDYMRAEALGPNESLAFLATIRYD
jgi:transcriptional regulator with XRE-family HTH domain